MKNWYKILDVPEYLARHQIIRPDGSRFGFRWANCLVRYFEHEQGAMSVTYPAIFWLDNKWHSGEIEVGRDGSLLKRLTP